MSGTPRDTLLREMELIKGSFYEAVMLGRGDKLQIGPETLLRGQIWLGSEALGHGLVDGLGSFTESIKKAAHIARIRHYSVADLRPMAGLPEAVSFPFFIENPEGLLTPYPKEPGIYLLFIPPVDRRAP